jgi:hypothetical protein
VKTTQIIRIAVALAIIFAAGVLIGRWTAPSRTPFQMAGTGGKIVTTDSVLALLTAELGLDAGQRTQANAIIEEFAEQMAVLPPASPQRREVFRKCMPRIREILRPDQYNAMDRYVEMAERRWNRQIRRRESLERELPPPAAPEAK